MLKKLSDLYIACENYIKKKPELQMKLRLKQMILKCLKLYFGNIRVNPALTPNDPLTFSGALMGILGPANNCTGIFPNLVRPEITKFM